MGGELTEEAVDRILAAGIEAVRVRSVLYCLARRGVCRTCYGQDLATHLPVLGQETDERLYTLPVARKLTVRHGQEVKAGTPLCQGRPALQDILRIQGREALQAYLLQEIQRVYRNTGVHIHDKHIEVILRQMLRFVAVETPGDTALLRNDLVDRFTYEEQNTRTMAEGGEPASARAVLLGITKATLNTDGFLASASFQNTTRVLADAALQGRTDTLRGLKESVIVGQLIPAGTGFPSQQQAERKSEGSTGAEAYGRGRCSTAAGTSSGEPQPSTSPVLQ